MSTPVKVSLDPQIHRSTLNSDTTRFSIGVIVTAPRVDALLYENSRDDVAASIRQAFADEIAKTTGGQELQRLRVELENAEKEVADNEKAIAKLHEHRADSLRLGGDVRAIEKELARATDRTGTLQSRVSACKDLITKARRQAGELLANHVRVERGRLIESKRREAAELREQFAKCMPVDLLEKIARNEDALTFLENDANMANLPLSIMGPEPKPGEPSPELTGTMMTFHGPQPGLTTSPPAPATAGSMVHSEG
jgi:hypothetical protein